MAERHLRPVGKDCLIAFGGNLYSVPARKVRPRQLVEIRATKSQVMLRATVLDPHGETLLAMHPRTVGRGVRDGRGITLGRAAHRQGPPDDYRSTYPSSRVTTAPWARRPSPCRSC
ncbi:Mu transposase domain-containing protein [Streptomyces netropsis]|uniref:Mu transposase domain-containing protein n=1 Tax=Streptomyces netropsis TaxID=55404 RepID=UPI0037A4A769